MPRINRNVPVTTTENRQVLQCDYCPTEAVLPAGFNTSPGWGKVDVTPAPEEALTSATLYACPACVRDRIAKPNAVPPQGGVK